MPRSYATSGTSSSSPVAAFIYNETPSGAIDGSNAVFTLTNPPAPVSSLELYLNGQFQTQGYDYTLSGSTITFTTPPAALYSGLPFKAFYQIASAGGGGGTPGGNNTDIQFNNSGSFGGSDNFIYDGVNVSILGEAAGLITNEVSKIGDGSTNVDLANTILSSAGLGTINWGNQTLTSTGSLVTLDWGGFTLHGSNSNPSLNWDSRTLDDSGGSVSVDWNNRILDDAGVIPSLDWTNRHLIASDGTTVVLDWSSTIPVFHGQFADNETPSGTIDGSNADFSLANSPNPDVSLQLIYNGQFQLFGTDYTLSGSTITFAIPPIAGTWIRAYYRF